MYLEDMYVHMYVCELFFILYTVIHYVHSSSLAQSRRSRGPAAAARYISPIPHRTVDTTRDSEMVGLTHARTHTLNIECMYVCVYVVHNSLLLYLFPVPFTSSPSGNQVTHGELQNCSADYRSVSTPFH